MAYTLEVMNQCQNTTISFLLFMFFIVNTEIHCIHGADSQDVFDHKRHCVEKRIIHFASPEN